MLCTRCEVTLKKQSLIKGWLAGWYRSAVKRLAINTFDSLFSLLGISVPTVSIDTKPATERVESSTSAKINYQGAGLIKHTHTQEEMQAFTAQLDAVLNETDVKVH